MAFIWVNGDDFVDNPLLVVQLKSIEKSNRKKD
jgi:hypothetical protein